MTLHLRPYMKNNVSSLLLFGVLSVVVLAGCASKGDDFYKHQPVLRPLDVPPDLTIPETNSGFEIPEIGSVETKKITLSNGGQVSLKKDGRLRWLEIEAPPEQVWDSVKNFWISRKIPLNWQNLKLGLLETEWINSVDSEFAQDRFRTRIEPGKRPDTSELYLSHRGMQETFIDGQLIDGWVKNYSDPEIEIEVLGEMLSYFGLSPERKAALLDESKIRIDAPVLQLKADVPAIVLRENAARSWRFVMQAVDHMGHTVIERDKKAGWLEVRIESEVTEDFTPGFALSNQDRDVYRIQLTTQNNVTTLTILNDQGQPDRSEQAKQFLTELHKKL